MADVSKISPDNGVNIYDLKDTPARNMVTDAFSTSTAYAVGDYCIYDGVLYICTTAHEGAWASGDFAATTIADELKNAGGGGDMSSYQTKNLATPLTINGSSRTTVESALGALNTVDGYKQPKTLATSLNINGTTATTVEGALSALNKIKIIRPTVKYATGTNASYYVSIDSNWFNYSTSASSANLFTIYAIGSAYMSSYNKCLIASGLISGYRVSGSNCRADAINNVIPTYSGSSSSNYEVPLFVSAPSSYAVSSSEWPMVWISSWYINNLVFFCIQR